jgi:hypothetical protein
MNKRTKADLYEVCLLPYTLPEFFAEATYTRQIRFADWHRIMTAPLDNSFTEEDGDLITRLLYGVQQGFLKVVDELDN